MLSDPNTGVTPQALRSSFLYLPGTFEPLAWAGRQISIHHFPEGYFNWNSELSPVASVDAAARRLTLARPADYGLESTSRCFAQDSLAFIDAPGEFVIDAASSSLFCVPRRDDIHSAEIIVPTLTSLFVHQGKSPDAPVENVELTGLLLEGTDSGASYPDGDEADMVTMTNTQNVAVTHCHLRNGGRHGITLWKANAGNVIYGNYIEGMCESGIYVQGTFAWAAGHADLNHHHRIKNNLVDLVGLRFVTPSAGILVNQSGHNLVAHNDLRRNSRWLISTGTDMTGIDGQFIDPAQNNFEGNLFTHNRLESGGEDSADTALFNSFGNVPSQSEGNTIEQMTVNHGQWSSDSLLGSPSMGVAGVYTDNYSKYWTIRDVVVKDVSWVPYYDNGNFGHVFDNVSWLPRFDPALLDSENIGLLPDFAYAEDGFQWRNDGWPGLGYSREWLSQGYEATADNFAGDEHFTDIAGARVEAWFEGSEVRWLASCSNNRGTADVYIYGRFDRTVDMATETPVRQRVVYRRSGLGSGRHHLKIVVRGDRPSELNYVTVDAFGVSGSVVP
jgi:hypothetical protein